MLFTRGKLAVPKKQKDSNLSNKDYIALFILVIILLAIDVIFHNYGPFTIGTIIFGILVIAVFIMDKRDKLKKKKSKDKKKP